MTGIRYVSLHEASGYGVAATRYLRGLVRSGVRLTWTPMIRGKGWNMGYEPYRGSSAGEPWLRPYCNRKIEYDTVVVHTVPEYYPLWKAREPGKKIIGSTVWETDRPPRHWIPILNGVDGLMVPCAWNREVFRRHGVSTPIAVIPHIPTTDTIAGIPRRRDEESLFTFYTIATWTARKALWATIESYLNAFSKDDPVCLLIKTTKRDFTSGSFGPFFRTTRSLVRRIVRTRRAAPPIRLVTDELSAEAMLSLHARGDCYVSLSRSEGWGIGAYDAAAFGKPVVATGYGGQLDYLGSDLAYLVDYRIVQVEDSRGSASYSSDQHWAEPDMRHASQLMRRVFENQEEARARGALLAESVRSSFDESAISATLVEFVSA